MIIGLIHTCTIQKRGIKQKLSYTGGTGTPAVAQTVTGATSHKTGVVDKVVTGYIVVKTVSGSFTIGETISTGTFSATLSAQADYQNQSGEHEYYWTDDQTLIPCRFYYPRQGGMVISPAGQTMIQPLKVALPDWVTIDAIEYRITNTTPGYTGTFRITSLFPQSAMAGIHHYEANLEA